MYLVGMIVMAYNLVKTARSGKAVDAEVEVAILPEPVKVPWTRIVFAPNVMVVTVVSVLIGSLAVVDAVASVALVTLAVSVAILGTLALQLSRDKSAPTWHRLLEGRPLLFTSFSIIAVLIGGVAEIVPSIVIGADKSQSSTAQRPYSSLELEGRDVYLREGCYVCHSQMIRPMVAEALRYGEASRMEESRYDHPFQWGSKRTGPDLARVGAKYPNLWHYRHMMDPRSTSPGSNMPTYAFLADAPVDFTKTPNKLHAMQQIGVPYSDTQIADAEGEARRQAQDIARDLEGGGVNAKVDSELIALVSYLQRLGVSTSPKPEGTPVAKAGGN
jgi:cytochrome c oxidase cbb3-type subunit I/II